MNLYKQAYKNECQRQMKTPLEEGTYRARISEVKELYEQIINEKSCDMIGINFCLENGTTVSHRYFADLRPESELYIAIKNLFGHIPDSLEKWRLVGKECRVKIKPTYLKNGKPWNAVKEVLPSIKSLAMLKSQELNEIPDSEIERMHEQDNMNPYDESQEENSSQSTGNISAKIVNPPPKKMKKIVPIKVG